MQKNEKVDILTLQFMPLMGKWEIKVQVQFSVLLYGDSIFQQHFLSKTYLYLNGSLPLKKVFT